MILELTSDGAATLLDQSNFRSLAVRIVAERQDLDRFARIFAALMKFDESDHVWLVGDAVMDLRPGYAHAEWRRDFLQMIEKAKPHGWVNAVEGTVRAHVVWQG